MILAIDPGASGGIAWGNNPAHTLCAAMPEHDEDILKLIRSIRDSGASVAYIEKVGGFTGKGQPGSAMFKFGDGCGFIRGCCKSLGLQVKMVRPQDWQKVFGLGTTKQAGGKTQWKNKLKAEAGRLYPGVTVTLKTADALLILQYANRIG